MIIILTKEFSYRPSLKTGKRHLETTLHLSALRYHRVRSGYPGRVSDLLVIDLTPSFSGTLLDLHATAWEWMGISQSERTRRRTIIMPPTTETRFLPIKSFHLSCRRSFLPSGQTYLAHGQTQDHRWTIRGSNETFFTENVKYF